MTAPGPPSIPAGRRGAAAPAFGRRRAILAAALLLAPAGCGPRRPPTVAVAGRVVRGGSPVAGAAVTFAPLAGGRPATGVTDAEGRFRLTTFRAGDGAVLGEHVATVYEERPAAGRLLVDGLEIEAAGDGLRLPKMPPHARPDTSPLRFTVEKGMPPVEIDLPSQGGA